MIGATIMEVAEDSEFSLGLGSPVGGVLGFRNVSRLGMCEHKGNTHVSTFCRLLCRLFRHGHLLVLLKINGTVLK